MAIIVISVEPVESRKNKKNRYTHNLNLFYFGDNLECAGNSNLRQEYC